jgi:hypothetical protein
VIHITYIYLITNIDNNPNKVYIGKANIPKYRKHYHNSKFGKNITYDVIDIISYNYKHEWKFFESYWIEQFKHWGFEILNKNKGGGGPEFHSEYTKNEMKGKPKPKGFGENHSKLLKGITKPEGFGDKLSKIKMGTHLSLETRNKIGKSKTNHKCYSDPKRGEKIRESKNKSVLQYDLNNNFIKEFESGQQASKHTLIDARGISLCCRKKGKTAGGFKWKFKYL